ncbi:MAG TPA: hypothetical protein VJU61_23790 [Polyangiaceae bacterium]|nr:hypothetical protein [Polyangiaceae bacterium]
MWARVKGKTENALLRLPFRAAFMFRPGLIQALHGITSRTPLYRTFYVLLRPGIALAKALFPHHVTTTERIGLAMLRAARHGAPQPLLDPADINALAALGR